MEHWPDCLIVHTTDGSPKNLADAQAAGFATRADYFEARYRELECALAKVGGRNTRTLGFPDQDSWRDLTALTHSVHTLIDEIRPDAVITHPYEGGHPDHDACSFAVQYSCTLLGNLAPERLEAAFYNGVSGRFHPNEFLPGPASQQIILNPEARARKREMFACFSTQQRVLSRFSTEIERYRKAPHYTFTEPPHVGPLNYETLGWDITSAMWIEQARIASAQLRQ